jgi:L-seryl-tRNA(Ser) seleniumtransferase
MSSLRSIPSIDQCLQRQDVRTLVAAHGHAAVVAALRQAAREWRDAPSGEAGDAIAHRAARQLEDTTHPSLREVINATGVIIHTNLGRAPLAAAATSRAAAVSSGYANLEYDLDHGGRGHRHVHAERLICALTGAEAATVVNNNAAATMLVLGALASGREVLVSRGELVEIGGGFRVPDIMAQSGAVLREVGTTNRTRVSDYTAAANARTALVLRVHPSNFRIEGFTERPALDALARAAHDHGLPLFEDLGSGWLGLPNDIPWPEALREEPTVRASLEAGVDLVAFSGDKLLGGPQAGIIAGRADLVARVRQHPLMRAVRADKQTYAALEATLALWLRPPDRTQIPLVRMLLASPEALESRATALCAQLQQDAGPALSARIVDGFSTIGGGSAPQSTLPSRLVALRSRTHSAAELEALLRVGTPPVIARVHDDEVLLDLRTVNPDDDARLAAAILADLKVCPTTSTT